MLLREAIFKEQWANILNYALEDIFPIATKVWKDNIDPNDL